MKKILKNKKIMVNIIILIIAIYNLLGLIIGPTIFKQNGNLCKGFPFAIKICSGDINAE